MAQTNPPDGGRPTQSSAPETAIDRPQQSLIPLRETNQIQLQLVNCKGLLDCALASLLLPKSTRIDQLQLQFDNPASVPAQILNTATVVRGNFTGYQPLYIEKGETLGAKPLSDYLGLLLWGLSADVTSRSLSGLQGQKE